jgi:hypothetical protein
MEQVNTAAGEKQPGENEHHENHQVTVMVDGRPHTIAAGDYLVSRFKTIVGVPADYELDQVIEGEFKPLSDTAEIKIKDKEVFVSHVRRGGSS